MVAMVSKAKLADLCRRGKYLMLVALRTPAEYDELVLDFAHNVPLDPLDPKEISALGGSGQIYILFASRVVAARRPARRCWRPA